jgi:hypothetical protein
VRYWLTPADDPAFEAKVVDICTTYQEAPARVGQGERTVSTDELTGVQALERVHPDLALAPGKVQRRAFAYKRHGCAGRFRPPRPVESPVGSILISNIISRSQRLS